MSLDGTPPARKITTAARRGPRFSVPRGLLAGTLVAAALVWGPYVLIPRSSLLSAQIQTGIYLSLLLLTICSRRAKVLAVRILQRYTLNPLFRLLLAIGVNPFGLAILETRGRLSGKTRRVPVGNGRKGDSFWITAEHGSRAGWVRNIQHDPRVRSGCASDCATAGCPASPPSALTRTRSPGSGRSSPGTRCAR
jgi:F420H(2)-dependent quinone reductase